MRLLRGFSTRGRFALALCCCRHLAIGQGPAVSPNEAAEVDPETLWFPQIFIGHVLIVIFLQCWWMLGGPCRCAGPQARRGAIHDVTFGVAVGFGGWILALTASSIVTGVLYVIGWQPEATGPAAICPQVPAVIVWLTDLPIWRKRSSSPWRPVRKPSIAASCGRASAGSCRASCSP